MLKSAVRMRETPFQRHKFEKISDGDTSPDPLTWTRLMASTCTWLHIRVSPSASYRLHRPVLIVNKPIVISSKRQVLPLFHTRSMSFLRDFLFSFVGKFWNKHLPPVEMPSVRHWITWRHSSLSC